MISQRRNGRTWWKVRLGSHLINMSFKAGWISVLPTGNTIFRVVGLIMCASHEEPTWFNPCSLSQHIINTTAKLLCIFKVCASFDTSRFWTCCMTRRRALELVRTGFSAAFFLFSSSHEAELKGKIEKQNSCFSISSLPDLLPPQHSWKGEGGT